MESSRLTDCNPHIRAAAPTRVSLNWNWCNLVTLYKSIDWNNKFLNGCSLAVFCIWNTILPLYGFAVSWKLDNKNITILPYSSIIQDVLFNETVQSVCIDVSSVIIIITLVLKLLCLKNHKFLHYIYPLINLQIHNILYPFHCLCFAYKLIDFIFQLSTKSTLFVITTITYMVLFILYTIDISYMTYADNNSIINPNTVAAEWFYGITIFIPLYTIINTFVSVQFTNLTEISATIVFVINSVLCISLTAYMLLVHPFLSNLTNDLTIAVFSTNAFLSLLNIIPIWSYKFPRGEIIILTPILFSSLFVCARYFNKHQKFIRLQFLDQLDSSQDHTVSSIKSILESFTHEYQLRTLIYEGLASGNKTVTTFVFLQYFCERFKNSKWANIYGTFLYAIQWGGNMRMYRFLLNMLSSQSTLTFNLQLYQALSCYAQTAAVISPAISRELENYRNKFLKLVFVHKVMWESLNNNDADYFIDCYLSYHVKYLDLCSSLKRLTLQFPFCPSVYIENSIFLADIKHDFLKSSSYFKLSQNFLRPDRKYVEKSIYDGYSHIFKGMVFEDNKPKDEIIEELCFLSIVDSHDQVLKINALVSENDEYLKIFSSAYSVPTNTNITNVNFNRVYSTIAWVSFILIIVLYILSIIYLLFTQILLSSQKNTYTKYTKLLKETVQFRSDIQIARQDTRLIMNIINGTYNSIVSQTVLAQEETSAAINYIMNGLLNFSKDHLASQELSILKYRSSVYDFDGGASFFLPGCVEPECHMSYFIGALHQYILYIIQSNAKSGNMLERADTMLMDAVRNLTTIVENVYIDVTKESSHILSQIESRNEKWMKIFVISTITELAFLFGTHIIAVQCLKKNLYDVLKTVQPSIIQKVSSVYDKLFDTSPSKRKIKQPFLTVKEITMFVIAFLILFVHSITEYTIISKLGIQEPEDTLPPTAEFNQYTYFMSFAGSIVENYVNQYINNNSDTYVKTQMGSDVSNCINYMFDVSCENCVGSAKFENVSTTSLWFYAIFCAVISFVFASIGFNYGIKILSMPETSADILKFIPLSARKSNPVISSIMIGTDKEISEVNEFRAAVSNEINKHEFYCILYLDELGNVDRIIGNAVDYLGFKPRAIESVLEHLIEVSPYEEDALRAFFAERPVLDTRSVDVGGGKEVSLTFSRGGRVLFVKDDIHHRMFNTRLRRVEVLEEAIKQNQARRKAAQFADCIVAVLHAHDVGVVKDVAQNLERLGRVPDTRFYNVVFIGEVDKAPEIISMVKALHERHRGLKAVVNAGGPVSIFSVLEKIEKPRLFGAPLKEAKEALETAGEHELVFMDEFRARFM